MKKMKRFIATLMTIAMMTCLVCVPVSAVEVDASENEGMVSEYNGMPMTRAGYTQFVVFDAGQQTKEKSYSFKVTKACVLRLSLYARGTDVAMRLTTPFGTYYYRYGEGSNTSGEALFNGDKVPAGSYSVTLSAGNGLAPYIATGGIYTTDY